MTISVVDAGRAKSVGRSRWTHPPPNYSHTSPTPVDTKSRRLGHGRENVTAPATLAAGDRFSTKMRLLGLPIGSPAP